MISGESGQKCLGDKYFQGTVWHGGVSLSLESSFGWLVTHWPTSLKFSCVARLASSTKF